jgi:hypothetical protein
MGCSIRIRIRVEVRRFLNFKPAFVRPIRPVYHNQFLLPDVTIIAMKACTVLVGPRGLRRGMAGQTLKRNSTNSRLCSWAPAKRGELTRRSRWSQRREDHQDLVSGVVRSKPELARPTACYPPAEPRVKVFESHSAADCQVELLQAHLVAGNFPESTHQGRPDALVPARELRLQVADNTPVRDERAGIAAESHPPSEGAADAGKQDPALAWVEAGRKSIDGRADLTRIHRGKRESRRAAGVRDRYPACGQLLFHHRISLIRISELDDVEVLACRHG